MTPEPVDPSLPEETDERAREIRAEIAQTRDEMSETIEAIQDRLKPSTIVANATETVRHATTEKVKQVANTAGDAADMMMNNSFMDTVRANPVPAAMIGIGAAWLLMKSRSDSRGTGNGRYAADDFDRDRGFDWRTRTRISPAPADVIAGDTSDFDTTGGDLASRASEYADDVKYAARRTRQRAQTTFDRVLRENPLALGAAATLIGAAIGVSMPSTDVENQAMGDARDAVVERARGVASQAADQVKDAASRAADTINQSTSTPSSGGTR